ncbi:MAG: carboxyl transferase domain-containing protein [Alphaproteobacteria bacterium]|nr:carboxyl transferase domain-containing protein [Alphaproteobacteria bacterium]
MSDERIPEDWQILLAELERRTTAARQMGGAEKLQKRAAQGRRNARELVELFIDPGSFEEVGTLAGGVSYHGEETAPADALVGGIGRINGAPVVLTVEDFTVQGGSIGHGNNAKRLRLTSIALQHKLPFIMLLDGAGARMSNALQRYPYSPIDLQVLAQLAGKVPTIAVVVGASAGHSSVGGLLMDFVIMLKGAVMFAAGPPLVAAALGEVVSKEELGGAAMHTRISGVAHNMVESEDAAARLVRDYLAYFQERTIDRAEAAPQAELLRLIPAKARSPYDMVPVIQQLLDMGSFLQIQPDYGRAMVTGLARLNGHALAVVANQPAVLAGAIDATAAEKAADFITRVDNLGLPVLFLADTPGVMSGAAAERAGTLRSTARMYHAQAHMQSPKLHVTIRKAFGFGSFVMAMNPFDRQTISLGLPGVSLGRLPVDGGAQAANLDDDSARRLRDAQTSGAWTAGDELAYDEIVDPRDLRQRLITAIEIALKGSS